MEVKKKKRNSYKCSADRRLTNNGLYFRRACHFSSSIKCSCRTSVSGPVPEEAPADDLLRAAGSPVARDERLDEPQTVESGSEPVVRRRIVLPIRRCSLPESTDGRPTHTEDSCIITIELQASYTYRDEEVERRRRNRRCHGSRRESSYSTLHPQATIISKTSSSKKSSASGDGDQDLRASEQDREMSSLFFTVYYPFYSPSWPHRAFTLHNGANRSGGRPLAGPPPPRGIRLSCPTRHQAFSNEAESADSQDDMTWHAGPARKKLSSDENYLQ